MLHTCIGINTLHGDALSILRGDQDGLFKLVMQNFIFKWYN
jgi:hypothetical protein